MECQIDSNYITVGRGLKLKIEFLFLNNCLEVNSCILPIVLNNNVNQRRPNYLCRERIPKFFLEKSQFYVGGVYGLGSYCSNRKRLIICTC